MGDFYFQSEKLADKKADCYGFVAVHAVIYLAISLACAALFWSLPIAIAAVALSVLHFVVDSLKFILVRSANAKTESGPNLTRWFSLPTKSSISPASLPQP